MGPVSTAVVAVVTVIACPGQRASAEFPVAGADTCVDDESVDPCPGRSVGKRSGQRTVGLVDTIQAPRLSRSSAHVLRSSHTYYPVLLHDTDVRVPPKSLGGTGRQVGREALEHLKDVAERPAMLRTQALREARHVLHVVLEHHDELARYDIAVARRSR